MRNTFTLLSETVDTHMNYISQTKSTKIEIKDTFSRYANDIIASVAFGIKVDSVNNRDDEFYTNAKKFASLGPRAFLALLAYSMFPKLSTLIGINITPPNVIQFLSNIIMETIKIKEEKGTHRPDMISLLIEARKQRQESREMITNENIVAQALSFLFAGFGTVSNALVFCTYELSRNPDVQARLQSEIDNTFLENGKVTYESLMKMNYMNQVISEALRMWPTIRANDRTCTKPYTIEPSNPMEKKVELQPGDLIWACVPGLHRDPKYFPNPEVFDPDRFSDENKGNINPYTYIPFGIGPRTCLGTKLAMMEIKAYLFNLLSKYTFVATSLEPAKISKVTFDLRFDGDVWVELKPRN